MVYDRMSHILMKAPGGPQDCLVSVKLSLVRQKSEVDSASNSRTRGPGFDTRFGHILSFPHPLIQKGQLSVTGKSMFT